MFGKKSILLSCAACLLFWVAAAEVAQGSASAAASVSWTYTSVLSSCRGDLCKKWGLQFANSTRICSSANPNDNCISYALASATRPWQVRVRVRVRGLSGYAKGSMGADTLSIDATATRANDTLYITGTRNAGLAANVTYEELAVIRYQGSASSLDSAAQRQLANVQNWVTDSLIAPSDVLLKKTYNEMGASFNFKVAVVGIADTQLVILASGHEHSANIPTLSEWALIIFSVVLLGLMTYYVIRRRQAPVPA